MESFRVITWFILTICSTSYCATQDISSHFTARQLALGKTTANSQSGESLFGNPAGLASSKSSFLLKGVSERRWVSGLTISQLGFGARLGTYDLVGVKVSSLGFEEYRETEISMIYSRNLSEGVKLGVRFSEHRLTIKEYGTSTRWDTDLGIQWNTSPSVMVAIQFQNILSEARNRGSGGGLYLGTLYSMSEQLQLSGECRILEDGKECAVGLIYKPIPSAQFYFSTTTPGLLPACGFSFIHNQVNADIGVSYHPFLGYSMALGLSRSW